MRTAGWNKHKPMGIIDEALKKIGGKPSPEEESRSLQMKNAAELIPDLQYVAGRRKKRRPFSFLLAVALVGAGVIVYLLLPNEIPQPARNAKTGTSITAATPSVSVQKAIAGTASSVAIASVAASAIQVAPSDGSAVDAGAGQIVSPPEWYEAGWSAARSGKLADALALWENGVRGLPRDRMVIVSNSYTTLDLLLLSLGQHAKMFPAIGVRQHIGGRTLYRVIVFPYGGGTREVLPNVQNLFLHAWLVNASRVQESMDGHFPSAIAKAAQETVRGEAPVAGQKPPEQKPADQKRIADQKPPAEKLEAISKAATETVAAPKPGDWEGRSAAVREQLKADDYPGVGRNAQTLARDFPERWEPWFWLGTAQLAQGQVAAAEASLERAGKLNPKVAQIWVQRAIAAQERSDHATAVRLLNEARELEPKSPQIYLNLGYSNDSLGLTAEAEKSYLRFLSLTEGDGSYVMQRKPIIERLEKKH